jgi:uridine monophosphate synthetase
MAETFFSLLDRHVDVAHSLLCIGLDPHPDDLPARTAEAAVAFCLRLVKLTSRYAAAFKPNAAFFEVYGAEGWVGLKAVIDAIREESDRIGSVIPIVLDAKRGDIASTAEAYARAAFEALGAQAVTVSPYLGHDSVRPFLADPEKGVFLLCKTSNPGSTDLQDQDLASGILLYERVADLAQSWNSAGNVGLVVGATQPEALARVRARAPGLWILAPGVGAQGGDLERAVRAGLRADGRGLLLPVSRAISRAPDPARAAADLRDQMLELRRAQAASPRRAPANPQLAQLATDLIETGCVKFGSFTLKSGLASPIYLDLRRLITYPLVLQRVARLYAALLNKLSFDRLAGLPYAALPIGTAVALEMNRPLIYPRREAKGYGTQAVIEGEFRPGETIAILDDLITTGGAKVEAIDKLTAAGLRVRDIIVLIDRGSGGREALAAAGYQLHAVATLRELLPVWRAQGQITAAQFEDTQRFLISDS